MIADDARKLASKLDRDNRDLKLENESLRVKMDGIACTDTNSMGIIESLIDDLEEARSQIATLIRVLGAKA